MEIVRGRLEGLGPVTAAALAAPLGLPPARSTPRWPRCRRKASPCAASSRRAPTGADEWCERRLLARIHRYTVKRLRAEIEPIAARDFLRFLFEWQRVTPSARMEGPDAVGAVLGQLEGFEAPASAWETEILPARIKEYEPAWLDEQCLPGASSGRAWRAARAAATRARRRAGARDADRAARAAQPAPVVVARPARRWRGLTVREAQRVADISRSTAPRSSMSIVDGAGLLPIAGRRSARGAGRVGHRQLRQLRGPARAADSVGSAPPGLGGRRRRRVALFGMDAAGRWRASCGRPRRPSPTLPRGRWRRRPSSTSRARCCAAGASCSGGCWRARRPGCRRGATCSCAAGGWRRAAKSAAAASSPASPASSSHCPRPSACCATCAASRPSGSCVSLSGADPLNLVGILTPGARLPALDRQPRALSRRRAVALLAGGEVRFLETLPPEEHGRRATGCCAATCPSSSPTSPERSALGITARSRPARRTAPGERPARALPVASTAPSQ